jgi:hypothetical protein
MYFIPASICATCNIGVRLISCIDKRIHVRQWGKNPVAQSIGARNKPDPYVALEDRGLITFRVLV